MDADIVGAVRAAVREVSSTAKALRLYPPSSPIPRQSALTAVEALEVAFEALPVISLQVSRDGFDVLGTALDQSAAAADLSGLLQSHGVAEVAFTPGCDADQLVAFLGVALREPGEVIQEGGVATLLAAAGVVCVSVADVRLTVVDGPVSDDPADVDAFLRNLANDPQQLSAWLGSASQGDPATLQESLLELSRSVGVGGKGGLLEALSQAFMDQDAGGRDALLGLALEEGPVRDLTGDMLSLLPGTDVAETVVGGLYGKNMLSLSTALTALPISERFGAIMSHVQEILPSYGHDVKELEFLDHMIEARREPFPEAALVSKDDSYTSVLERTVIADEEMEEARTEVAESDEFARKRTVGTLVSLLDQQKDFSLYCQTLESLASMVPRLLADGDLALARRALSEISSRESSTDLPWPEVADRLRTARATATGGRAMADLLAAVAKDPDSVSEAHDIMQIAGDEAPMSLVEEALAARDFDGLATAERILGRRMVDLLPAMARRAQWFQVAPLAARLANQGDQRSRDALASLVTRPDAQSRREAAKGLAASANPSVLEPLGRLLHDEEAEVAITAARALAATGASGSARTVADQLEELDVDGKDFTVARELIGALSRMQEPAARETLESLAHRRALIKRGHFTEIQELAREALGRLKAGGAS